MAALTSAASNITTFVVVSARADTIEGSPNNAEAGRRRSLVERSITPHS
jgi:hypothetical protein